MNVIITRKNRAPAPTGGGDELQTHGAPTPGAPAPTSSSGSSPDDAPTSDLITRLVALIPVEVTTLFVALQTAVTNAPDETAKYAPVAFLPICAVLVVLQLRHLGRKRTPPVAPLFRQYVLSVLAFLAWGASIADPLAAWGCAIPRWILTGAIILVPFVGALLFDDD